MGGVESAYHDGGISNRWIYRWYGTDGSMFELWLDAETGLYYSDAVYTAK